MITTMTKTTITQTTTIQITTITTTTSAAILSTTTTSAATSSTTTTTSSPQQLFCFSLSLSVFVGLSLFDCLGLSVIDCLCFSQFFLVATMQLYKRVCSSVCRLVVSLVNNLFFLPLWSELCRVYGLVSGIHRSQVSVDVSLI